VHGLHTLGASKLDLVFANAKKQLRIFLVICSAARTRTGQLRAQICGLTCCRSSTVRFRVFEYYFDERWMQVVYDVPSQKAQSFRRSIASNSLVGSLREGWTSLSGEIRSVCLWMLPIVVGRREVYCEGLVVEAVESADIAKRKMISARQLRYSN
jgi:hypothetical protein